MRGDRKAFEDAYRSMGGEPSTNGHEPQTLYRDGIWDVGEDGRKDKDERPRLRSVRFNEIEDSGPRRYLLDGLIPEGYPTLLHGDGGAAKSMLALSFGLALSQKADGEADK